MNRVKIHIEDHQITSGKAALSQVFRTVKDGWYAIELKNWSGYKTWLQIKTIHGPVVKAYSNYTGLTRKKAKRELKLDHGHNEYFEKDGEKYVEIRSLSDYSKSEMRGFIESVLHHLEFECGIIVDLETRQQLMIDTTTGELTEIPQNH